MNKTILITAFLSLTGCAASNSPPAPDPIQMANRELQDQMQLIASETVKYLKRSNDMVVANDPETDWLSNVDKDDPINQRASLGFVNGVWSGSFKKLISDVAERSGYKFVDLLNDSRISNYQLTLSASNSTLLETLYAGYSNVPNHQINLVVRQDTQTIILRNKCDDSSGCDGLRKLSAGTPRIPN